MDDDITDPLETLAQAVGHAFHDPSLLAQAMTHSTFAHENEVPDNERLEFLGDAVLQLASTVLLMDHFPDAPEGQLSRLRSRVVSTKALAALGRRLDVGAALQLGVGEQATGGRDRPKVLAGAMEALLGAVYTDAGMSAAHALVAQWLAEPLRLLQAEATGGWKDPRSLLQERLQRHGGPTPTYEVVDRAGPAHEPRFVVEVRSGDELLGRGEGRSKRAAAKQAAEQALRGEAP
ncbi:MAG: ribonuclease III [Myxococcales bacterium]|nr:ribonuclease III [Myxococcales bacterium]